jgi:WD40 repeat protein
VRLWDLRRVQGAPVVLRGHDGSVNAVAFSPDGKTLATASDDHLVRLWNVEKPETAARVLQGHAGPVSSVAFSPDGRWLASASRDQTVRLWDLTAAQSTGVELRGHTGAVNAAVFSPDGRWLVSASHDQTARLWDLAARPPTSLVLRGHTDSVNAAAFSPDGRHLFTVSSDHNTRMWDFSGDQPASFVLEGHSRPVTSIAFAPDGRHFATSSWDTTVRVWVHYPALNDLIAAVFAQTQRCLTAAQRATFGLANAGSGAIRSGFRPSWSAVTGVRDANDYRSSDADPRANRLANSLPRGNGLHICDRARRAAVRDRCHAILDGRDHDDRSGKPAIHAARHRLAYVPSFPHVFFAHLLARAVRRR